MAIVFSRIGCLWVWALVWSTVLPAYPARIQAAETCALAAGERGRVAVVVDGRTLTLDTGLEVRLIGVQIPDDGDSESTFPEPGPATGAAVTARGFLRQEVVGRTVQVFYGGRRRDRHGRALAHVFVYSGGAGRRLHGDWAPAIDTRRTRFWVQGRLVAAGLALAASFADNRACMAELLDLEAAARTAGRHIWDQQSGQAGPVVGAQSLRDLFGARHRFQIVEGTVRAAGVVRGTTYLNFGDDWRRDFTIVISPRARRRFLKSGLPDLGTLSGRRVQVRGWVGLRNGPFIEADHPEQLKLLNTAHSANR